MLRYTLQSLFFTLSLTLLPTLAWGQFPMSTPGSVSATGVKVVKRQPELMRMIIVLSEKDKTLREALTKLKDRREIVLLFLEQLGADKDSIDVTDPTLSSQDSTQQQQVQRMIQQQLRARGRSAKKTNLPKYVTVSSTVTAEWALEYKNTEELLFQAVKLQDNIVKADLAGLKEPKQLSPEEEEMAEEMAEMMSQYGNYGDEESNPSEPQFTYVAIMSEEDRQKAVTDAFAKARKQAERLSAAAGVKLGALLQLNSTFSGMSQNVDNYGMNAYMRQMMRAYQSGDNDEESTEGEAFGKDPGLVTFTFNVMASFRLE